MNAVVLGPRRDFRVGVVTVAAVLCVGLFAFSCRRSHVALAPAVPSLGDIQVVEASPDENIGARLDEDAIASAARRVLLNSGLVVARGPDAASSTDAATVRAKVTTGVEFVEVEKKGVVRTGVAVQLITRPSDAPGAIEEELSAGGEEVYDLAPAIDRRSLHRRLAQRLVERTLTDLLTGFVARVNLRTAPPQDIHAAINADGGASALREEAIRVAGVRGLRDEVPALLLLLQDDNEALRDAALGALIALREQRAVTVLTRNRSLRDRHEMRKILDAIAIIGGSEARDYLSFVAESHDDEEIRKMAVEAKARLERRPDR